jgi:hypothetical protein
VPFIGFTALEIIGAPLFVFWQKQVEGLMLSRDRLEFRGF